MDDHGIDRTWLLSWECPPEDYAPSTNAHLPIGGVAIPFEDVLQVGREAPDRFVLGYIPHPKRPDAVDRLRAAVDIHGVRVAGELKVRLQFDDPDAIRLYRACGELGLPVTTHLQYPGPEARGYPRPNWWYGGSIEALERALTACPETIFIGHAQGFWANISGDGKAEREAYPTGPVVPGGKTVEMMRKYGNLYADLSAGSAMGAISRDPGFGKGFLLEFQDRLLFARDQFNAELMDFLTGLDLPKEAFEKIAWRNAQRLVRD
jgi:predicted TIM-barrel fold metal-dependent hydrolase